MKKKFLPILLTSSLLLNVVVIYFLANEPTQEERGRHMAIQEISFAITSLEGCEARWNQFDYTEAVAHLYAVCQHVESLRKVEYSVTTQPFQELYGAAAFYPEVVRENEAEMIAALSKINTEDCLTDEEIMGGFKAFTEEMKIKAVEAELNRHRS